MTDELPTDTKFVVKIYGTEKAARIPKTVTQSLKGVAGAKTMARMRKEAIHCPLLERERPFLECFACESFNRRVMGEVHCAGIKATIFK